MFKVLQHLLPNARAWRTTADKKLRRLLYGASATPDDVRQKFGEVYSDLLPPATRALEEWEHQFGLPATGITVAQRRSRLDATWKALGGQDPEYLQTTLRANGFDVYVHEWWEPGSEPSVGSSTCATPRNPLMWLRREYTGVALLVECGESLAQCGEQFAQAGNGLQPRGYPLVNKVFQTVPDLIPLCGESVAACGESVAACGNYTQFVDVQQEYIVPSDPAKWPYFLYIGGQTFGSIAQISPARRDEFEALCLKICPAQQWLGMLVEYN